MLAHLSITPSSFGNAVLREEAFRPSRSPHAPLPISPQFPECSQTDSFKAALEIALIPKESPPRSAWLVKSPSARAMNPEPATASGGNDLAEENRQPAGRFPKPTSSKGDREDKSLQPSVRQSSEAYSPRTGFGSRQNHQRSDARARQKKRRYQDHGLEDATEIPRTSFGYLPDTAQ